MKKNTMTKSLIAMLLLGALIAALIAGCGGNSPSDVVKEVFQAYNDRDFDKVYDLSSSTLQAQAGDREKALQLMEASWPPGSTIVDVEITDESIDGDKARVTWSGNMKAPEFPDQPGGATINMVREDGQWKIDQ